MYHNDSYDNSIVIDGFEKGIADSPFDGIANMRNCNIVSVPGEASVNFATIASTHTTISNGTISAVNSGTDTITYTGASGLENNMAIAFTGSLPTGLTAGTVYWISKTGSTFKVYSNPSLSTLIDLTSTTTGGSFTVRTISTPKYSASIFGGSTSYTWVLDDSGAVWSNLYTTTSGYFIFMGNVGGGGTTYGNGLVIYQGSDGKQWIFVFRTSCIDYAEIALFSNTSWHYGWNPSDATVDTGATNYLKTANAQNNSHEAFVAPDSRVYFCDSNWIGRWYQTDPTVAFVPTTLSTFTFDQTALLPTTDTAQCLTFLGTNILIGGKNNIIYPWNRFSTNFSYPILLPEYNVKMMVTVNTNTFIFVGNRGRIYYTNGSQAELYKKIPDHISGTVEPYFTWGGACSNKNQLYFSLLAYSNSGSLLTSYGGVWAIDLDTKAIRLSNKLSYDTYGGYATTIIPNFNTNPAGVGLIIGWYQSGSTQGIDSTSSSPYTGSQADIDTDLIPIGTFNRPKDFTKIEYKLTRPLVSGESVVVKTRLIFNTSDTGFTTALTDSTVGNYSGVGDINFKNAQWVQFQIVLNSTASSPSFVRLKQLRILGVPS